jgi:hypothetical protein
MRQSRSRALAPLAAVLVCMLSGCQDSASHAGFVTPTASATVLPSLPSSTGPPSTRSPQPSPSAQLVTPPAPPSLTCGKYGLVAETSTSYTYLLACSGGTLSSPHVCTSQSEVALLSQATSRERRTCA